jgi:SAM-dependent methyltransferase
MTPPPAVDDPAAAALPADSRTEAVRDFYERALPGSNAHGLAYRRLLARYYRHLIPADASVLEVGCGSGELLALLPNRDICGVDLSARQIERACARLPHGRFFTQAGETLDVPGAFDVIILSETLNQAADLQRLLERLHAVSTARTRLIFNFYSGMWRPILAVATALGIKAPSPPGNWLGHEDIVNLCDLADWQILRSDARILCPTPVPVLEPLLNRYAAPWLPWLCLTTFCVARPRGQAAKRPCTVSVVVPARNEAGNIEAAVLRTPELGAGTELIFIEGHSRDDTWEAIQRVAAKYPERRIKAMRQTGKGKGNAVREAFAAATGDILMILDADLTMPPEELPKFYRTLASGHAEFANGVRLVYPMEERAMRFLNFCANKTFSMAFSWLLGQPVKDTLCGTKALFRCDYEKIAANRAYFGDFDPFGDFDLLFGADKLNLKIADIPIRYRERTYGTTNIQRWSHGWLLLRMVAFAARKLKFI